MARKLKQIELDLIESIQNERRPFDMAYWTTNQRFEKSDKLPTCKTASCMAGHIMAIRPKLAKTLLPAFYSVRDDLWDPGLTITDIDYPGLAKAIWEAETKGECTLDFHGWAHSEVCDLESNKCLEDITRKEAIAHIRGRSKRWPRLRHK